MKAHDGVMGYETAALIGASDGLLSYRARAEADGHVCLLRVAEAVPPPSRVVQRMLGQRDLAATAVKAGVPPTRKLLDAGGRLVLELDAAPGAPLAEQLGDEPVSVGGWLDLAVALARQLARCHAAGLVHRNLHPGVILIDPGCPRAPPEAHLIDLGFAGQLDRYRTPLRGGELPEQLAYVSPEQTGRTSRGADHRADLYSLGVILYRLATGRLPFPATEPLELIHAHLAEPPPNADHVNPQFPPQLAVRIARLLAKEPEARYQSAHGLLADLETARAAWMRHGGLPDLLPERVDLVDWFALPARLVGREQEYDSLRSALGRVAAGGSELVLVAGASGSGKTRLIEELRGAVAMAGGRFVDGKCDQVGSHPPYAPVRQAMRELVRQLLAEPQAEIDRTCHALATALDANAAVIGALVPETAALFGTRAAWTPLLPQEAAQRFKYAVRVFLDVVSPRGHPLVVFLDDLQWADAASLDLIGSVLGGSLEGVLVVAAARPDDAAADARLRAMLQALADREVPVTRIDVRPLDAERVNQIVFETLRCGPERARPLAEIVVDRTGGSPLLVQAALARLYDDGVLRFDGGAGTWTWDPEAVAAHPFGDDAVALMVDRLARLSPAAQDMLATAACLGHGFDVGSLALATGTPAEQLWAQLEEATARGILHAERGDDAAAGEETGGIEGAAAARRFAFLHDRVQQAAAGTLSDGERQRRHARIAEALISGRDAATQLRRAFDIVQHVALAKQLPGDVTLRHRLAEIALHATETAARAMAHRSAADAAELGLRALGEAAWQRDYPLALALTSARGEVLVHAGDGAAGVAVLAECLNHVQSPVDRARLHGRIAVCRIVLGDTQGALDAGAAGLAAVGFALPRRPGPGRVGLELLKSRWLLKRRTPAQLIDAPPMQRPEAREAMAILMDLAGPAYQQSAEMAGQVFLMLTNIALRHGASGLAGYAYTIYGLVVAQAFGDFAQGWAFAQAGVALAERSADPLLACRAQFNLLAINHHWTQPAADGLALADAMFARARSLGDLRHATYANCQVGIYQVFLGRPLPEIAASAERHLEFARDANYPDCVPYYRGALQFARHLAGLTHGAHTWNDDTFDEGAVHESLRTFGFRAAVAQYRTLRMYAHVIAGRPSEALALTHDLDPDLHALDGQLGAADEAFARGLALSAAAAEATGGARAKLVKRLRAVRKKLAKWAAACPGNFGGRLLLIDAELAAERPAERQDLLAAAAAEAQKAGHVHVAAMALERGARLTFSLGRTAEGATAMRQAVAFFDGWGAHGKVRWLKAEFPDVRALTVQSGNLVAERVDPAATTPDTLDLASAFKAAGAIASEIHLDSLLGKVLAVAMENAGASRGHLVLERRGALTVAVRKVPGVGDAGEVPLDQADDLAASVVRYVSRTGETLVLADACQDARFARDPYAAGRRGMSVLCTPLVHQGSCQGILYLENDLAAGAFTAERTRVTSLLSTQAAIAIDNARLYHHTRQLADSFARFVPRGFLKLLGRDSILDVGLGDAVTREMTVLFSDLRGFTALSERIAATQSFGLLNDYLRAVSPIIAQQGGFVDKFIGDAILALFSDTPDGAVLAAVEMQRALQRLNAARAAAATPLQCGIGLHHGPLMLGTVGHEERLDLTVIGDTVNVASRLEGATKHLGATVVLSAGLCATLRDPSAFGLRPLGHVGVAGRDEPLEVVEVFDADPAELADHKRETSATFAAGLDAFRCGLLADAGAHFAKVVAANPQDGAAAAYAATCRRWGAQPQAESWRGELRLGK